MTRAMLHLPIEEIERRCLANLKTYETWPTQSERIKAQAQHWRDCLQELREYQAGTRALGDLHPEIREMGWQMPAWGTYGT